MDKYDMRMFGSRMQTARKQANLTGEELAEKINLNTTYIRQLEGGAKTPSLHVFISICKILNVSPSYLLRDYISTSDTDCSDLLSTASPAQTRIIQAMISAAVNALMEK